MMSSVVALLAAAPAAVAVSHSSRWWFGSSDAHLAQAEQIVEAHPASITGLYFYWHFAIHANGTFTSPPPTTVATRIKKFQRSAYLTVGVALAIEQTAVESGSALLAVNATAAAAAAAGVNSLIIDYEPRSHITLEHARAYATLIAVLADELHRRGPTLEICVSSWSILTQFGLYAATGVDGMMSMASTYFGTNLSRNEDWVQRELRSGVSLQQLRVGIGSTNHIHQKWNYNWTEARLRAFVDWLIARRIRHLDVWRTDIDALNATNGTEPWVYDTVRHFLKPRELATCLPCCEEPLPGRECCCKPPECPLPPSCPTARLAPA